MRDNLRRMRSVAPGWFRKTLVCSVAAALWACAAPPPAAGPSPAPTPAPEPPAEPAPYRPLPPLGAAYDMEMPRLGPDGLRVTVNSGLDRDATLWHFRSAWNVAALNCRGEQRQAITDAYGAYLKRFKTVLDRTNTALEKRYRAQHPEARDAMLAREAYMTRVYNYFAMPPVRADVCNVMAAMAGESLASPVTDPWVHSAAWLPRLEAVFQEFFRVYEQYRVNSAAWDARWGEMFGHTQPGYVAVHGGADAGDAKAVGEVLDPDTGARIPVIDAPSGQ
jgi:hypothetical protein